jgi:hypothetical protein
MKRQVIIRGVLPRLFLSSVLWLTVSRTVEAALSGTTSIQAASIPSLSAAYADVCDHIIGRQVGTADGLANYSQVKPGDRVCIEAGTRNRLKLYNFAGTPQEPIIFINFGGQLIFNQTSDFAILIKNSRYFRVTGSGDPGYQYGIKIDGNYSIGVNAGWQSSDMEFDHIEVSQANVSGIMANTKANCSDGSNNAYDYDGDGEIQYDLDDVVTKENFTQYNTILHHNYIHDTHSEGLYIGNNRTVYASYGTSGPGPCPSSPTYPLNPVLDGVLVYSNIFERVGWESINVKGAINDCRIYRNQVYEGSTQGYSDQVGEINLSLNSHCDVYNNYIKDGYGPGIRSTGTGGRIYNNVIIHPGRGHASSDNYASGIYIFLGTRHEEYYIWNNTIIEPRGYGICFDYEYGSDNRIQNNIIVNPGQLGDGGYIYVASQAQATVSHNLTRLDLAEVKLVNPTTGDYSLLSDSPAVDQGVDLSSQGINVDYEGVARPQGSGYDIGAYELVSEPSHTPTSTPTSTATSTGTPTILPTSASTPTSTPTPLLANTPTPTSTATPPPTYTSTPTPTNVPSPTYTPSATATPTSTPTNAPTSTPTHAFVPTDAATPSPTYISTLVSVQLTIDEPLYAGATVVTGGGAAGKLVVVSDPAESPILASDIVDGQGRYAVDLSAVLEANGKHGLEAHQIIQAEMEGQVYRVIVHPPIDEGGVQIFLPMVNK